jgi:hypothetical protein
LARRGDGQPCVIPGSDRDLHRPGLLPDHREGLAEHLKQLLRGAIRNGAVDGSAERYVGRSAES